MHGRDVATPSIEFLSKYQAPNHSEDHSSGSSSSLVLRLAGKSGVAKSARGLDGLVYNEVNYFLLGVTSRFSPFSN